MRGKMSRPSGGGRLDGADMSEADAERFRKIQAAGDEMPERMKRRKNRRKKEAEEGGGSGDGGRVLDMGNGGGGGDGEQQDEPKAEPQRREDKNALNANSPVPLWMEKRGITSVAQLAGGLPAARASSSSPSPPPLQPPQQQAAMMSSGQSEVTIVNQTDTRLRLVAYDQANTGQKVESVLYPKQSNAFVAPMGCALTVMHPETKRAVLRYKVVDAATTLVVTDAQLTGGGVGTSGKWYDNRPYLFIAGVGAVCALLALVGGAAFLIHWLAKKYSGRVPL